MNIARKHAEAWNGAPVGGGRWRKVPCESCQRRVDPMSLMADDEGEPMVCPGCYAMEHHRCPHCRGETDPIIPGSDVRYCIVCCRHFSGGVEA